MNTATAAILGPAAILAILAYSASAEAEPAFDVPSGVQKQAPPPGDTTVTCLAYPHFIVKQVDSGDIGAKISIIAPGGAVRPSCRPEPEGTEIPIESPSWAGYFKGAVGDYLFLEAAKDGDRALGFAIFAAGKLVFEDAAVGSVRAASLSGAKLTLRYTRSFAAACSMPRDGAPCWKKIAAATGLDPARPPDCAASYQAAMDEAKDADEPAAPDAKLWTDVPSVVNYDAEATIGAGPPSIRPLAAASGCRPAD